ncbi:MAG: aldehyde ferredoxin oxidoreductase [Desulfobacteraceae bacterium]|nr:aldehyde ferredoxin oxidoreductase [Desulfobacteraceae bacterium]
MKFIKVNMTDKSVSVEDVPQDYMGLGGRGLTSIMINAEVPATCDPLGPENKLIFAPGLLSGTILPNTSRLSIGAKSPLTGGIKESNVGGTVADALGKLGITAIIVEGQAPEGDLSLIKIDENGEASLVPAQEYKGMRTYALVEKLQGTYGKNNSVTCIGPAGENQLGSASVQTSDVDDHPCRAAGRGGMGAVMGAKGIKAIVVDRGGKSPDALADPEAFKEGVKVFVKAVKENPFSGQLLPALGTAAVVAMTNSLGGFPSYNATKGTLEGFEKISGETMAEVIKERGGQTTHVGCSGCVIHCSNVYVDKEGQYMTSSLEYETLWSFGGMLGITDLDTLARCDFLCDDIGLDTINTGDALAVAMDAGHKEFGDNQAALDMIEEIGKGSEIGKVLGNGPVAVGKHFNHARVPAVKGQGIAAYDPRAMQGLGVTYATSPMGADHTAGNLLGDYLGGTLNPLEKEGQVEASRNTQIAMALVDNAGICLMASFALMDPAGGEAFGNMINAKLGVQLGPEDGPALGMRILQTELEFNRKAGFTKEDDRLPKMFYEEPLPPHNKTFLFSGEELDETLNF